MAVLRKDTWMMERSQPLRGVEVEMTPSRFRRRNVPKDSNRRHRRIITSAHLCSMILCAVAPIMLWQPTTISAYVRIVAMDRDPAPGTDNWTFNFDNTVAPIINSRGQVAFASPLRITPLSLGSGVFLTAPDPLQLRLIARSGLPAPDNNGNFGNFELSAMNASGQLAFNAFFVNTFGGGFDAAAVIHAASDGRLTVAARQGQGNGAGQVFSSFQLPSINSSGDIAFRARTTTTPGLSPYLLRAGGELRQIAGVGQSTPAGNNTFLVFGEATLADNGDVIFSAAVSGASDSRIGIWTANDAALVEAVDPRQDVPDGNGRFSTIRQLSINNNGDIAFIVTLTDTHGGPSDNEGLFLFERERAVITTIARKGDVAPDGNGRFLEFADSAFSINDSRQVAFAATLTATAQNTVDRTGIFRSGPELMQIVRTGDSAPDGNGRFVGLAAPAINVGGQVAFRAAFSGTSRPAEDAMGLFLYDDDLGLLQAARSGEEVLPGATMRPSFRFLPNAAVLGPSRSGLSDLGRIAFAVDLSNGRSMVAVADPLATPPTRTPTNPPTPTPTGTHTPTTRPTRTVAPSTCSGDCNGDQIVTTSELRVMVNKALGNPSSDCVNGDENQDGMITVDEIVRAVNRGVNSCTPTCGGAKCPPPRTRL